MIYLSQTKPLRMKSLKKTEDIKGVKFVNINPNGTVVVTHGDDFDESAFKAAAGI
jgi:hypothetical protein